MANEPRLIRGVLPHPSPSLVLTQETNTENDSTPTYGASLRRSCHPEYLAAEQVYSILDEGISRDRSFDLRHCRESAWFVRHDETGELRVASRSCRLRWCPVCARSRKAYIAHEVAGWLDGSDHPKFMTLTLKHTNAPLDYQVDHLYKFFQKLRARKEFAKAVTGGIWFFHIKKSKDDGLWHPHLHCLITGLYLPQRHLRHLWVQVTYGSEVVDIRAVHDYDRASCESARYAACPGSLAGLDLSDQLEMVEAMHGRRICGTWGTGRKMSLRPEPQYDRQHWDYVGGWQEVTGNFKTNPNAQAILLAWKTGKPLPSGITYDSWGEEKNWWHESHWNNLDLDSAEEVERSPPCSIEQETNTVGR